MSAYRFLQGPGTDELEIAKMREAANEGTIQHLSHDCVHCRSGLWTMSKPVHEHVCLALVASGFAFSVSLSGLIVSWCA